MTPIGQCLSRARMVQYGFATLVSLSGLAAGGWLTWPSTASPLLLKGSICCKADAGQVSTMVALMDLGNVLTPIPASYLSDALGRKPVIHSTAVLFIGACLCAIVADNMWYLYIGRLLAGMGKGIVFGVVPVLIAEISQDEIRGSMGGIFLAFVSIGNLYDYIIGSFISYQGLNVANIIVPIIFGIGCIFIPESPYYLVMKSKKYKAIKSLSSYRQLSTSDLKLTTEIKKIEECVEEASKNKSSFFGVASSRPKRRALMITTLAAIFQRACGISALLAFSTITLPEKGAGLSREVSVIIFSFMNVIANYLGLALVDRLGRKSLLLISSIAVALSNLIFAIFFTLRSTGRDMDGLNWIPYANLQFYGFAWGLGLCYIPSILLGELFPTNVKSHAGSLQSMTYALASFLTNKFFGLYTTSPQVMFFIFFSFCVASAHFAVFIVFETKGKTFSEIQSTLKAITGDDRGTKETKTSTTKTT